MRRCGGTAAMRRRRVATRKRVIPHGAGVHRYQGNHEAPAAGSRGEEVLVRVWYSQIFLSSGALPCLALAISGANDGDDEDGDGMWAVGSTMDIDVHQHLTRCLQLAGPVDDYEVGTTGSSRAPAECCRQPACGVLDTSGRLAGRYLEYNRYILVSLIVRSPHSASIPTVEAASSVILSGIIPRAPILSVVSCAVEHGEYLRYLLHVPHSWAGGRHARLSRAQP
ncbi:hypothetical protein BZA05DRAFT_143443 [Tricharina praecox]|uniref:uncharacterized protein n=1 Tax=Tricharina praecox TaxID=43433 RepID=UPI00221EC26B|nr:uncharacterized protein BZA05DRAFT_143443 [Tricharina praecox]KAI5845960.1 hypothetical protein BZA05DRAFT_143443 [Tricharina praecox]